MAQFAQTSFFSEADDSFSLIDALNKTDSGLVTSVANNDELLTLIDYTGLRGPVPGDALDLTTPPAPKAIQVSRQALYAGICSNSSGLNSAINSLPDPTKNAVLKASGQSDIKATIDGIKTIVSKADLSTVQGLGKVISEVSGSHFPITFKDDSGLTLLSVNIIQKSTELGVPNSFKAFSQGLNDPVLLSKITKELLPVVVSTSNVNLLDNVSQSPVASEVRLMSPSFVTEFARNYKHNAQANSLSMRQTYDSVAASFTRIDPNWDRKPTIGSQYALYLKVFASASKDFIELMKSKVSNTNVVMPNVIAPTTINTSITPSSAVAANLIQGMQLPDTDAKGRLKESFPYTLI